MPEEKLTVKQQEALNGFHEEASKAITTGYTINPNEQQDGAALRREFLEDQIQTLTWAETDLQFFRDIPKVPSESTVAQYVVQTKHGRVGHSRFVREIDVATQNDPHIRKRAVRMKYVSDTRQVSLASTLVDSIADPTRLQTDDAIAVVAKTIEWASFYGDASLTDDMSDPDGGVEFTGLAKLIAEENVVDARGESLSEELLNYAAVLVGKGYGVATDAYMPIGVHADFINQYLSRQTQLMRDNNGQVTSGYGIDAFRSARGLIKLHGSTVMELDNILDLDYIPQPLAPRKPNVVTEVVADGKGAFRDIDLTEQNYVVVAFSDEGQSEPSDVVTANVAGAKNEVKVKVTLNGLAERPQFVNIYRQGKETGEFYLLERVGVHKMDEDGVITFTDTNATLPETADVFVGEMSPQVINLFELLPMMRLPLAQMNATITFSVLWYGALALRAPKRWVRIKNVKMLPVDNPHGTGI